MPARLRILAKLLTTIILGRYMRKLFVRGLFALYMYTLWYLIYINKSMMFLYFEKKVLKREFFKKKKLENMKQFSWFEI